MCKLKSNEKCPKADKTFVDLLMGENTTGLTCNCWCGVHDGCGSEYLPWCDPKYSYQLVVSAHGPNLFGPELLQ